MKDVIFYGKG